jgi:hypothetical protein
VTIGTTAWLEAGAHQRGEQSEIGIDYQDEHWLRKCVFLAS